MTDSVTIQLKDIEFGEIKEILLSTSWDLNGFGFGYSKHMRLAKFPEEIDLDITYERYIQTWRCHESEEFYKYLREHGILSYEHIVNNWEKVQFEHDKKTKFDSNFIKKIMGLTFRLSSLQYLDDKSVSITKEQWICRDSFYLDHYHCPKCSGHKIVPEAKYCQECGVKLKWDLSEKGDNNE